MEDSAAAPAEPKADDRPRSLEERAKAGEKLSLDELARASGNFIQIPSAAIQMLESVGETRPPYSLQHCAAAALHGWDAHTHATVDPHLLTLADYLSALKAIDPPKGFHTPVPHKPACSPYTPHDPDKIADAHQEHLAAQARAKKAGN